MNWENLTNEDCINVYSQQFVTVNNNVLAVTSALSATSPVLNSTFPVWQDDPDHFICYYGCDANFLLANWTINVGPEGASRRVPIQYCLSQPVKEHCTLQFSILIITIVLVCNITKLACMVVVLLRQQAKPLVTLGDAVESFLETPDPIIENMCLADKKKFSAKKSWSATRDLYEPKKLR